MEYIEKMLMFIGAGVVGLMVVLAIIGLYHDIVEKIRDMKQAYKDKHRFDKPPTAECYCVSCRSWKRSNYDAEIGYCEQRGQSTSDVWFCWEAKKRNAEERKTDRKRIELSEELEK